jgi:hypothetical protein
MPRASPARKRPKASAGRRVRSSAVAQKPREVGGAPAIARPRAPFEPVARGLRIGRSPACPSRCSRPRSVAAAPLPGQPPGQQAARPACASTHRRPLKQHPAQKPHARGSPAFRVLGTRARRGPAARRAPSPASPPDHRRAGTSVLRQRPKVAPQRGQSGSPRAPLATRPIRLTSATRLPAATARS